MTFESGPRKVTKALLTLHDKQDSETLEPELSLRDVLGGSIIDDVYQDRDSSLTVRFQSLTEEKPLEQAALKVLQPEKVTRDRNGATLLKIYDNATVELKMERTLFAQAGKAQSPTDLTRRNKTVMVLRYSYRK